MRKCYLFCPGVHCRPNRPDWVWRLEYAAPRCHLCRTSPNELKILKWLREESAFIRVAPVERLLQPFSIIFSQSDTLPHGCMDSPGKLHRPGRGKKLGQDSNMAPSGGSIGGDGAITPLTSWKKKFFNIFIIHNWKNSYFSVVITLKTGKVFHFSSTT